MKVSKTEAGFKYTVTLVAITVMGRPRPLVYIKPKVSACHVDCV